MTLEAHVALQRGSLTLDVNLDVDDGEIVAVLGPNGAGKTTLLAALAGLVPLDRGEVRLDGEYLEAPARTIRVPPERRSVGVVFQDGLLFPHLSAQDNVAFGLRARGVRRGDAVREARRWLERVGVGQAAGAEVAQLSGGQAQRVALARALVTRPRLLLLDEPLAAVDAAGRAPLRREIAGELRDADGVRVVVTHDPVDAMALADTLVILEDGHVTQRGTPVDLRRRPRSRYAADLVGVNLLRGRGDGRAVALDSGAVIVAADAPRGDVFVLVHPRSVALHRRPPEGTPRNVWRTTADAVEPAADRARVQLGGPVALVAEVTAAAVEELALMEGGEVWATVKATEVSVYDA
ncbi:MAG: transporter ATP-binding protein [Acidimicrobiales bacterium]|nr:transporter ATP-binding protein [Acidimicrobiales bacterium]